MAIICRPGIKDQLVINIIDIDEDEKDFDPGKGLTLGEVGGHIGDKTVDGKTYVRPEVITPSDSIIAGSELLYLDKKMTRAEEDIISAMVKKGVMTLDDFGDVAKENYEAKKAARLRVKR